MRKCKIVAKAAFDVVSESTTSNTFRKGMDDWQWRGIQPESGSVIVEEIIICMSWWALEVCELCRLCIMALRMSWMGDDMAMKFIRAKACCFWAPSTPPTEEEVYRLCWIAMWVNWISLGSCGGLSRRDTVSTVAFVCLEKNQYAKSGMCCSGKQIRKGE